MIKINNYITSVLFVILFCVVIEAFAPSEKYAGIIKMVSGIFIIYTLIMPIKDFLDPEIDSFNLIEYNSLNNNQHKEYEQKMIEVINDSVYHDVEKNIENDIKENFGEELAKVSINKENFQVTICGASDYKLDAIYKYIEDNYGIKPLFAE